MLSLKSNVLPTFLRSETLLAIIVFNEIYSEHGINFVITSIADGKHKHGSLHYTGYAFDCRTKDIDISIIDKILVQARIRLGAHYDIIFEGDHIHVEFDPKTTQTVTEI